MAKSAPTITGSVRIGANTYNAGQEDELASVATPDQLARLTEKGTVSGFSGSTKSTAAEPTGEADNAPASGTKSKTTPKGE